MKNYLAAISPRVGLLFLVLACLLPFVNKAVYIDDTLFLRTAEQIQKHPLDFYGFQINWYDRTLPMVNCTENPPLASYYLALVASLAGWSEVTFHLAFLLVAWLAVWGTYLLARNYCRQPLLATVIAVLTPAFMVSATTLMCDVMLLAFWVWALVYFERGLQKKGAAVEFAVAGCLAGLAVWTKFFGLGLVPLLAVYGLVRHRRAGWWLLAPGLPLLFAAGYEWAGLTLYGHDVFFSAAHFAAKSREASLAQLGEKLFVGLVFLGGCYLPGLFYLPGLWRRWALLAGPCLVAVGMLFIPHLLTFAWVMWNPDGSLNWLVFLTAAVLAVGGGYVLLLALNDFWNRRDAVSLFLLLWFMGVVVFTIGVNWTINGRSLLPGVPVLGILVVRRLELATAKLEARRRWRLFLPLLPAGAIALLAAGGDYEAAGIFKTAAKELLAQYQQPGRTLWFQGHWGFQYYLEQGGGKPMEETVSALQSPPVPVQAGDILVVPAQEQEDAFIKQRAQYRLLVVKTNFLHCPVVTMNPAAGAAFYASKLGPFPFAVTRIQPQCFWVYQCSSTPSNSPPGSGPRSK